MPASTGIDDEQEKTPPVLGRNNARNVKKMSFGTGSKLNIPKTLSIDVEDEGDDDVDELSNDKNPVNRSQTSGVSSKQTPRTMISQRTKSGANLETSATTGHKKTASISSNSSTSRVIKR